MNNRESSFHERSSYEHFYQKKIGKSRKNYRKNKIPTRKEDVVDYVELLLDLPFQQL
jgi:hypothetical protein